ncbi:MAG: hypothetical protein IJS01_03930 [Lentisphaeria bacterium]|nr:hypothetical protein [Lentisphaeria bacterium]
MFFEYHFHGCAGHKTIELDRKAYEEMSLFLAEKGETDAFLAGFSAAPVDELVRCLEFCRELMESAPLPGARLAGVYLEGPFLHVAGGMTASLLAKPSVEAARRLVRAGRGILRNVAVAPELEGALPVIEYFASEGIRVSAGHFFCSPAKLREAVACGITGVTHFCNNGEGPLCNTDGVYHTDGPFLEILSDDRLTVEMICDGVHVPPELVKTVRRVKGRERFIAVTDGCAATGLPGKRLVFPDPVGTPAEFDVRNGALYIAGTDKLTGSLATMNRVYANLIKFCGLTDEEALYACSGLPRKFSGVIHDHV